MKLVHYVYQFSYLPGLLLTIMRYKRVDPFYRPFFWFIWLNTLGELFTFISAKLFRTNAMAMNVYTILEALLVMYILCSWDLFKKGINTYYRIAGAYLAIFLIENFYLMSPSDFNALGPTLLSSTIALTTNDQ